MYKLHNHILSAVAFSLSATSAVNAAVLEEITVTAQKREQSAQDIGLAVTAFDSNTLRETQSTDIFAIADQLPNVQAYASVNVRSFTIRGIGLNEFDSHFDSPVAVHMDEVFISKPFMVSMPFFDMGRVEALKGPQGTLFGRNTTGGAVNFYTQEPTQEFTAGIDFGVDSHDRYRAEGYVSGGITEQLSGRFSFYLGEASGGPYDNLYDGEELGQWNQKAFRGQLLWDLDETQIRLLVHSGRDKSTRMPFKGPGIWNPGLAPAPFCDALFSGGTIDNPGACLKFGGLGPDPSGEVEPSDPHTVNQDYAPKANNEAYGGFLRIDHDLGWADLTSITAFETFDQDSQEDSDSSIYVSANTDWYATIDQFTQELRLVGDLSEQWHYVAGLFYEHDELEQFDSANLIGHPLAGPLALPPGRLAAEFTQEVDSYALFVHSEYEFSEQWKLNLGLRYTIDELTVDGMTFVGNDDPKGDRDRVSVLFPVDSANNADRRDTDFSFKLGLDWTPRDDLLAYASLTTGYRAGGYAVPFGGVITEFDPEEMTAWEAGLKSRWLDETLQVNLAIFFYEYEDLQVNVDDPLSPLVPITRNIGESETFGFEGDIWWAPTEYWDFKLGFGYLDAEFKKSDRAVTTYAGPIGLEGKRPVNTPEWTYNGLVRYERPVTGKLNLTLMLDFQWTDERFYEVTNQTFDRADSYYVANARIALGSSDGRWDIALWGRNITDEEYISYLNNIGFFAINQYGEPATYGLSFGYHY